LDIGVLGYIGIVQHKEHSPEVLSIPPGTPCIYAVNLSLHIVLNKPEVTKLQHPVRNRPYVHLAPNSMSRRHMTLGCNTGTLQP